MFKWYSEMTVSLYVGLCHDIVMFFVILQMLKVLHDLIFIIVYM